jgi:uncharacterized protein (DUF1015 family)
MRQVSQQRSIRFIQAHLHEVPMGFSAVAAGFHRAPAATAIATGIEE